MDGREVIIITSSVWSSVDDSNMFMIPTRAMIPAWAIVIPTWPNMFLKFLSLYFAQDVKGQKRTDDGLSFTPALDLISQIGGALSVIALSLTLVIYLSIR